MGRRFSPGRRRLARRTSSSLGLALALVLAAALRPMLQLTGWWRPR